MIAGVHSAARMQGLEIRPRIFSPERQFEPPLTVLVSMAGPAIATGLGQHSHHFTVKTDFLRKPDAGREKTNRDQPDYARMQNPAKLNCPHHTHKQF